MVRTRYLIKPRRKRIILCIYLLQKRTQPHRRKTRKNLPLIRIRNVRKLLRLSRYGKRLNHPHGIRRIIRKQSWKHPRRNLLRIMWKIRNQRNRNPWRIKNRRRLRSCLLIKRLPLIHFSFLEHENERRRNLLKNRRNLRRIRNHRIRRKILWQRSNERHVHEHLWRIIQRHLIRQIRRKKSNERIRLILILRLLPQSRRRNRSNQNDLCLSQIRFITQNLRRKN